tara:strand:+ start:258 stop:653 length:396 start_codon:yes stop_codon:yes gene_type:complete
MEDSFKIEIISPEKIVYSGAVKMVTLPSYEGNMGILKNHISIITFLRPGIVNVQKSDGSVENFFVQDGTIEYFNESLTLLSASVINLKNISKEFLENINKNTLNELENKNITDHERYVLNHKLEALKEIRV